MGETERRQQGTSSHLLTDGPTHGAETPLGRQQQRFRSPQRGGLVQGRSSGGRPDPALGSHPQQGQRATHPPDHLPGAPTPPADSRECDGVSE